MAPSWSKTAPQSRSAATWPAAGEAAQGLYYPLVWGQPGIWTEPDGTQRNTSGSPAFIVDESNNILLIADGRTEAGEQGLTVQVFNASADDNDQETAYLTTDGAGRTVTVVDLTGSSATVNGAHQYYVRWDNGGGAIGRRDEVVSNLGELVWYVLHRSGAPFDRGRIAALIPWLSQIPSAGYIDDPAATAWDWLGGNVLDLVPAGVAAGPEGPYLVPWLLEAYPQSAARSIRVGEGVYRIPGQAGHIRSSERDELANLPRLSYALRLPVGAQVPVQDPHGGGALVDDVRRERGLCRAIGADRQRGAGAGDPVLVGVRHQRGLASFLRSLPPRCRPPPPSPWQRPQRRSPRPVPRSGAWSLHTSVRRAHT